MTLGVDTAFSKKIGVRFYRGGCDSALRMRATVFVVPLLRLRDNRALEFRSQ